MAKVKKDLFVNRAVQRITQSAANVLTFQQINFAVGVFQGVALILHKLLYHVGLSAWQEMITNAESFRVGLAVSSQIADIAMTHVEVINVQERCVSLAGVAANLVGPIDQVITADFSPLPGGGILIPANPVYLAVSSAGLTTPVVCDLDMLFTFRELSDADYIELIQSRVQANL